MLYILYLNCNFTESSNPPWMVFTFFKMYKWYQIPQSVSYRHFSVRYGGCTINLREAYLGPTSSIYDGAFCESN